MSRIKQLTETIRNYEENELSYGTLKTLAMIDKEADELERRINQLTKQIYPVGFTDEEAEYFADQIG